MKKIIMLAILAMTVVGCELFSPNYWNVTSILVEMYTAKIQNRENMN